MSLIENTYLANALRQPTSGVEMMEKLLKICKSEGKNDSEGFLTRRLMSLPDVRKEIETLLVMKHKTPHVYLDSNCLSRGHKAI